jgi:hypothetical protein
MALTAAAGAWLVLFASLVALRPSLDRLWGDEGTFVAMTASLIRDGDLLFSEADLERARARQPGPGVTVILQQTTLGITYSKPLLYPLLSAPLFALLGESGLVATNALWLALALVVAWKYLRTLGAPGDAFWTLATFVACSVLPAYLGWKMSDLLQAALALVGLILTVGVLRARDRAFGSPLAAITGGMLLGLAVSMRFTAAAVAAAAIVALLICSRWQRALAVGLAVLISLLSVSALSHQLTGTANPYKAQRSSFNDLTGYPAGADSEIALAQFHRRPATQSATWRPELDLRLSAYSTLYFLVGRHTGLLAYFPAALMLLVPILGRPHRAGLALLAGVLAVAGFYLIWMPHNYFGGSTFLGNRYFLGTFPALLIAIPYLPSRRLILITWVLGLVAWSSALHSVVEVRGHEANSQSHAHSGVFRWLPFESTAQRIDGLQDRFWGRDYIRFLDPFARPAPWSFRLDARRPATELLVVTEWSGESLLFVVSPDVSDTELEVRDWRERVILPLSSADGTTGGLVEVPTSPAWRRHAFWWQARRAYRSRALRLSLRGPADRPATAVVRYVGRAGELAAPAARLENRELPETAEAGSTENLRLQVQNTGRRPWAVETPLPLGLGLRLQRLPGGRPSVDQRTALPRTVRPGETLELVLPISWPEEPGDYLLTIELLREPVERLGEHGRFRLAQSTVSVGPPLTPDSPKP